MKMHVWVGSWSVALAWTIPHPCFADRGEHETRSESLEAVTQAKGPGSAEIFADVLAKYAKARSLKKNRETHITIVNDVNKYDWSDVKPEVLLKMIRDSRVPDLRALMDDGLLNVWSATVLSRSIVSWLARPDVSAIRRVDVDEVIFALSMKIGDTETPNPDFVMAKGILQTAFHPLYKDLALDAPWPADRHKFLLAASRLGDARAFNLIRDLLRQYWENPERQIENRDAHWAASALSAFRTTDPRLLAEVNLERRKQQARERDYQPPPVREYQARKPK
jgi:hypothetical protein